MAVDQNITMQVRQMIQLPKVSAVTAPLQTMDKCQTDQETRLLQASTGTVPPKMLHNFPLVHFH